MHRSSPLGVARSRPLRWPLLRGQPFELSRRRDALRFAGAVAFHRPCHTLHQACSVARRFSIGDCEVVEGDAGRVATRDLGGDVMVVAAQVLHDDLRLDSRLQPTQY